MHTLIITKKKGRGGVEVEVIRYGIKKITTTVCKIVKL